MKVLDYSVGRPSPASIVSAGYIGVMRYVAPLIDAPKIVTAAEYAALRAAGLAVGLNWEWYANRAAEGAAAGTADATEALRQATALGYTGAIYFSVDFDAAPADQAGINAYFQGCAQVLGLQRLGAYAGYWPLKRLFDAGLIVYGWQTIAWSGGNRESRAHLYQNTFGLFGGDADGNEVLQANWQGIGGLPVSWTQTGPDTVQFANGLVVSGNLMHQSFGALARTDLWEVIFGEPAENQHQDADGIWRQNTTVGTLQVNPDNTGFKFTALSVAPPPPPPAPAPSDADLLLVALKKVFPNL